jgi:hypothetical protein
MYYFFANRPRVGPADWVCHAFGAYKRGCLAGRRIWGMIPFEHVDSIVALDVDV